MPFWRFRDLAFAIANLPGWLDDNFGALSGVISARGFGVVGNGVVDDTDNLERFFNYAIANGGDYGIPRGTYRVTRSIRIWALAPQRNDGARIRGSGQNQVIFDYRGTGPVFDVRGIPASNGTFTQSGTFFLWGLELSDFTINAALGVGNVDAFSLVGVWNAEFKRLRITNLRHGFVCNGDPTYNPNPDWSGTNGCKVVGCYLERITGWGFFNSALQAAPGWEFWYSVFNLCGSGGILMSSGGSHIEGNSFAGCGWSSEVSAPTANAVGLRFQGSVTAAIQTIVANNEFDTNFAAHVDEDFAGAISFRNNRYIFNDRYSFGAVCPTNGAVRFAPAGVGSAVQNVTHDGEIFRLDAGPTVGSPVGYNFVNTANVQNIRIRGAAYSDNNPSLNIVRIQGHLTGNAWAVNNLDADLTDFGQLSAIVPGRPFAEYIGTINGTPNTAGGPLTVIRFDLRESVNNQVFGATLYNTATGVFTCPAAGYYDVDFVVALLGTVAADYNQFYLYRNGALVQEWSGTGSTGARTWYQGRRKVFCNAGDTLDIRESTPVARQITGAYSYLRITLIR